MNIKNRKQKGFTLSQSKGFTHTNSDKSLGGFTIIEVLIVLAIAGLIMLIVFLAVPALQRNSRNTQYRAEATRLLSVTTEWINNNNGIVPAASGCITSADPPVIGNCAFATTPNNAQVIWQLSNNRNITAFTIGAPNTAATITPLLTTAFLTSGVICGAVAGLTHTVVIVPLPSPRVLTLVYAVENQAGAVVPQCTSS